MQRKYTTINGSTYSVELLPAAPYLQAYHKLHGCVGRFVAAIGQVFGDLNAEDLGKLAPKEGEEFNILNVDFESFGPIAGQVGEAFGELMADPVFMGVVDSMLAQLLWLPKPDDRDGGVLVRNREDHWHEKLADYHGVVWFALRENFGKVFTGNPGLSALMAQARATGVSKKSQTPPTSN